VSATEAQSSPRLSTHSVSWATSIKGGWYVCTIETGREEGREFAWFRCLVVGEDRAGLSSWVVEEEGVIAAAAVAAATLSLLPYNFSGWVGDGGASAGDADLFWGTLHWDINDKTAAARGKLAVCSGKREPGGSCDRYYKTAYILGLW
jgi:hypothetical protein